MQSILEEKLKIIWRNHILSSKIKMRNQTFSLIQKNTKQQSPGKKKYPKTIYRLQVGKNNKIVNVLS